MLPALPQLKLYLLGSFRLERDAHTLHLSTRKVESLLAYLALFPEQHSRERLAALFWGDVPDEQARHSLRTALASIRKELGEEILIADRESIQLNPDAGMWVDAREISDFRFQNLDLGISNFQSLISDYHELLPDFYDDWIVRERERLRLIYLDALLKLAQHYREKSEYALAAEFAQKILANDHANEKAHQTLIVCFAAQGDRIAALKQYDECKKFLRDELNAEPSSETTALRDQIMQELTGASSHEASLTNLPNPLTSFVGREKEIEEIKKLFGNTRLLTLTGVGGAGKTRLAIQVARDALPSFKQGIWWIELAILSDPVLVPQQVAQVLGVQESREHSLTEMLTLFIRDKHLLIALDNCEHLIAVCAELAEKLLLACPNLKIIATSREALSVTGETVWRVTSLAVPDATPLPSADALTRYDAVQLFVQRASAAEPHWKLDGNESWVAKICGRLDGIPLAIELAAARVKGLSVEQISALLDDRFRLLASGSRTALPRQQTLRGAIDWSYDLLSEKERVLFRRLAVFVNGWTLPAAIEVCSGDGIDRQEVMDLLLRLIDKSLATVMESTGETRYHFLETIRQYVQEKLQESGEEEATRNHHLDFFLKFAEEVEPKLRSLEQLRWMDWLDIEHDNMRAALEWSLGKGQCEKGLRLATALRRFWDIRGYWSEGLERVKSLLIQPEVASRTLTRANALLVAADSANSLGDVQRSRQYLEELIAIAREHVATGERTVALGLVSLSDKNFNDNRAAAEAMIEEGLSIAHALGDEWLVALAFNERGYLFMGGKDYRAARQAFEASLARFKSLGDKHWTAVVSIHISSIDFIEGEYVRARQEIETSLPFFREAKSRYQIWLAVTWLGLIAHAEENYDRARRYYIEALEMARESGGKIENAAACINLGYIAVYDGELNWARSLFTEGLAMARELGQNTFLAESMVGFASIATAKKQARHAIQLFAVADAILEVGDNRVISPADEAEYKRNLAIAREQLDDAAFNAAWNEGRAMTLEQAVEYALKNAD